jgi:hypothetical protein
MKDDEKDPMEDGFIDHFDSDGVNYMIDVKHYNALSKDQQEQYDVKDGQFLVHLFSPSNCRSFKVFLNEDLYWTTDAREGFVDREFIEVIGSIIDEKSFLGGDFHP